MGYGIGNKELIGFMHRVREPFNVNQLAQVAAVAALGDEGFRESSIRMNREERQKYYLVFRELGIAFIESQANFIFINVRNGDAVTEALLKLGLIVRPGSAFGCPEWIRVTIGTPEENTGLSAGLRNALSGA